MNSRPLASVVLAGIAIVGAESSWAADVGVLSGTPEQLGMSRFTASQVERFAWVGETLERMQTIKPGMTRKQLLEVFRTEGGLFTGLKRTYVSRDCPYFKVDVEFETVDRPARGADGRVTLIEADQDRIAQISRPYLEPEHAD